MTVTISIVINVNTGYQLVIHTAINARSVPVRMVQHTNTVTSVDAVSNQHMNTAKFAHGVAMLNTNAELW